SSRQLVPRGQTASFAVATDFGFEATVGGTCGVTHTGLHYTTRAITADCNVVATFPALPRYTVTPSASAHGSLTPNLPFVLIAGQSASFTVVPDAGYNAAVRGTCGGSLFGATYVIAPVGADCTVVAVFAKKLVLFVGDSFTL